MLPTSPFKVAGPATTFALVDGTASTEGTRAPVYEQATHSSTWSSQRTRRTRRRGNPSELGRLVEQAWHAQVASVIYVLTRLDDRRGWVTKSTLCADCPTSAKGALSSSATRVRSLMASRSCR